MLEKSFSGKLFRKVKINLKYWEFLEIHVSTSTNTYTFDSIIRYCIPRRIKILPD